MSANDVWPLLFLLVFCRLSTVSPMPAWVDWNQSRMFIQCPERLGSHPVLPVLSSFSNWEVPSWLWMVPAWGMGWYRQGEIVLFSLLGNSSQFFGSTLLLRLPQWTLEVSECCFGLCLAVWPLIQEGRWRELGFPMLPFFPLQSWNHQNSHSVK